MSSPPVNFPFFFSPPPPPRSLPPPPPRILSPPPPLSPVPSPDGGHGTIIVVVFISFGGLLFLAFVLAGLFCFIKKTRKKKSAQDAEILSVDRHLKVKEAIEKDSHGKEEVAISIEGDEHVEEKISKKEKTEKAYRHEGSGGTEEVATSSSSSGSDHLHFHHKA